MSIENLTRYEPVAYPKNDGVSEIDKVCMEVCKDKYGYVKFEEAKEASLNSLQQLKAEICAFVVAINKSKSVYETDSIVSEYCDKWHKHTAV